MKRGAAADRYVCMPVRVWDELRARGLALAPSPATFYAWLASGPLSSRVPGVVVGGPLAIAEAIGWDGDTTLAMLGELERAEMVIADRAARLVYLPAHLAAECSLPASPSTAAMRRRELANLIPCELRERIIADARATLAPLGAAWLAAFDSGRDPQAGKPKPGRARNQSGDQPGNQSGDHLSLSLSLSRKETDPEEAPRPMRGARRSAPSARGGDRGAPAGAGAAEVEQLLAVYCSSWVAKFKPEDGKPPTVDASDQAALRKLVSAHGAGPVGDYVQRYLDDADPFLVKRGHRLRDLAGRVDGYRSGSAQRTGFVQPMAAAPVGGKVAI